MTLDDWFAFATTDADRRSLPDMRPVLKGLQTAAVALRAAEWNDDARGLTASASSASSAPDATGSQPTSQSQASQSQPSPRASS
jgi:hypothetical protein